MIIFVIHRKEFGNSPFNGELQAWLHEAWENVSFSDDIWWGHSLIQGDCIQFRRTVDAIAFKLIFGDFIEREVVLDD